MTPHQRWTQSSIVDLRHRLGMGESVAQIATAISRSEADIRTISARLGLTPRLTG